MSAMAREYKFIEANGTRFAYLEAGEGSLVLCLHGFPDTPKTFEPILHQLAEAGFHAVAPATRGIHPSGVPKDNDYSPLALGRDVSALIEAFGANSASVIGHDWGAMSAYVAANLRSPRLAKIVTIGIPHPRAIRMDIRMMFRGWHFGFLSIPWLADFTARLKRFALLRHFRKAWSPHIPDTPSLVQDFMASYSAPGSLEAALSYYRAFMLAMMSMAKRARATRDVLFRKTSVPTLCFAGLEDGVFDEAVFDRTPEAFTGPYELVKMKDAGHFLHLERTADFIRKTLTFLR